MPLVLSIGVWSGAMSKAIAGRSHVVVHVRRCNYVVAASSYSLLVYSTSTLYRRDAERT